MQLSQGLVGALPCPALPRGGATILRSELSPCTCLLPQVIDARETGNLARFVNSSCAPNCQIQQWHEAANSRPHIGLFSVKAIPKVGLGCFSFPPDHSACMAAPRAGWIPAA